MKIGLIGCGAIGTALARKIDEGEAGDSQLAWVYDANPGSSRRLTAGIGKKPKIARTFGDMVKDKSVSIIIEAASQEAVRQYSHEVLKSGKDLMVISVGALADDGLLEQLRAEAARRGRRIYIPSGAIIGIDGVKSSALAGLEEATLTTRKPPAAFRDNEYLAARGVKLTNLRKPKVVFDGTAREAVKAFPASVNVAATLSLAGIGFDRTRVRVVADPTISKNIHEVKVRGESGELTAEARNEPFPDVPRTSYLAALSVIRTLKGLSETIHVGT